MDAMKLFRDHEFNIAVLLSATWHLIFIFSITPILASSDIKGNSATISFIGSILEKVISVAEGKPFSVDKVPIIQKIEGAQDISSAQISLMSPDVIPKASLIESDKENFIFLKDKQEIVPSELLFRKKEKPKIEFKDFAVKGEASNRLLLYKPDPSNTPILPIYFGSGYNVSIRFNISRHGFVENPECILSSGYPEVDQLAIRYIRGWQFVPYCGDLEGAEEGIIRVRF